MELLIFSEYEINIIARDLGEYQETAHDILLAILLLGQFGLQGFGIYKISEPIVQNKECALRVSRVGFLLSTSLDTVEAIALAILATISTVSWG
jgi:hypothetical protein